MGDIILPRSIPNLNHSEFKGLREFGKNKLKITNNIETNKKNKYVLFS